MQYSSRAWLLNILRRTEIFSIVCLQHKEKLIKNFHLWCACFEKNMIESELFQIETVTLFFVISHRSVSALYITQNLQKV